MESTSVMDAAFSLDDLRVEELEPRLEFTRVECIEGFDGCVGCQEFGDGDGDFAPLMDEWACGAG